MSRILIIGDVHGCVTELKMLLDKCNYSPSDRICMAGDLVDRGPDSPGVIRFLMSVGAEAVAGNHDDKLLRRAKHIWRHQRDSNYKIPMRPSADQEATIMALTEAEISWLKNLPTYIDLRSSGFNVVALHAGLLPSKALWEQPREVLTMLRYMNKDTHKMLSLINLQQPPDSIFWTKVYDGDVDVVYGHMVQNLTDTVVTGPNLNGAYCFGIDTGCVFGGKLSCLVLDPENPKARTFIQVPALKEYYQFQKP